MQSPLPPLFPPTVVPDQIQTVIVESMSVKVLIVGWSCRGGKDVGRIWRLPAEAAGVGRATDVDGVINRGCKRRSSSWFTVYLCMLSIPLPSLMPPPFLMDEGFGCRCARRSVRLRLFDCRTSRSKEPTVGSFGKDLELLDSPGILPMRIRDQTAALKLAKLPIYSFYSLIIGTTHAFIIQTCSLCAIGWTRHKKKFLFGCSDFEPRPLGVCLASLSTVCISSL
nr:uncharacterized protein LOC109780514 isoform X2 [Aegilops tauschii subsp. strangulata]